ncbi:hypothetical protein LTR70_009037 [Exophiala xenobiotica]|uniref:Conserved oligomeric Golgi complex subunit 2 n=1 Tax=Lithohypha guttulata TaxID=1690604 RepID=A0ABR0JZ52_9EURO|nr:hypothetical protein LTR24_008734 [Lithohypha guttulata]KAK5311087.1 hypothetical protein LTR70_009037 [Exophiala xenobiotica]
MASAEPGTNQKPHYSNDPSLSPSATRDPYDYDSDSASDTDTPLPFPKPLDRTAFLSPTFTAASFLSTLQNRFQTLEDLQSELQDLLRSLNRDLLDLVNDNYADFVDVGARLRGGEERIEEVRVGLLGFRGDVGSVAERVGERAEVVRGLVGEMRGLRRSVGVGRRLLEVEERLGGLERRVGVKSTGPVDVQVQVQEQTRMQDEEGDENAHEQLEMAAHFKDWDDSWTRQDSGDLDLDSDSLPSEGEDEDDEVTTEQGQTQTQTQRIIPRCLRHNLETLQIITHLSTRCAAADGKPHPFILAQRDRIAQVKDALRRELEAAIRAQSDVGVKQSIIRLRGQLDEE